MYGFWHWDYIEEHSQWYRDKTLLPCCLNYLLLLEGESQSELSTFDWKLLSANQKWAFFYWYLLLSNGITSLTITNNGHLVPVFMPLLLPPTLLLTPLRPLLLLSWAPSCLQSTKNCWIILNCYRIMWKAFGYFKLTSKILLYQKDSCVLTCIINSVMDTDLAVCDTYRFAQNAQVGPLCPGWGCNITNQENGNFIIQVQHRKFY